MAGQSEAADDLIAELAKLMAQDAQGDREEKQAATPAAPIQFAPVRISSESEQKPDSSAPTDFLRSLSVSPVDAPKPQATQDAVNANTTILGQQVPAAKPDPAPFHFDFGLRGSSPTSGIEDAPVVNAAPALQVDEQDTIADLISADLASLSPNPIAPVALALEERPAASVEPALMATTVAANIGTQTGESIGMPRADQDRFKMRPVFGLGSTAARPISSAANTTTTALQQPPAPAVVVPTAFTDSWTQFADNSIQNDPIDEIENLIGRAMRVEFDMQADEAPTPEPMPVATMPKSAPSPVLRSLATPTLPADNPGGMSAVDQTIFAAAQATGDDLDSVNEPETSDNASESSLAAPWQPRSLGILRTLADPLVAVILLLAAGFGLYWVLVLGSRDADPVPLLTADATPSKEIAPAVAADETIVPQSVVFNEMDGVAPGADEQLVSRDQTDINEVTQVATAATDLSEAGLTNRKVRTVKVRPDGTIVSGDDGVAGNAILPVDRPNVPAVPGAETAAPKLLASVEAVEPAPDAVLAETTLFPVQSGVMVPAVDLAGNLIEGKSAVVPLVRPIALKLPAASQAAVNVQATPEAAATSSLTIPRATKVPALGDTAPAYVQLASQRSEADARQSAQNMVTRYGPLFGGANLEVQRVDLGIKGIYYRVRVPASSLEQANMICTNVKAAGGDCFIL
ncbi:MAG: SPOR domain-containing protein [Candidatus Devosia symbiotica]|nr:SPOR domain-containing protein [Candidatus Devosia symbiotica]